MARFHSFDRPEDGHIRILGALNRVERMLIQRQPSNPVHHDFELFHTLTPAANHYTTADPFTPTLATGHSLFTPAPDANHLQPMTPASTHTIGATPGLNHL